MNNKMLWIVGAVVVVLIVGIIFYTRSGQESASLEGSTVSTSETSTSDMAATDATDSANGAVKEFVVNGSAFKFDPAQMTVKKGDKVKITFKNSGGTHDFVLDEFNAKTAVLEAGAEEVVEFTADKVGSFEYYCSVGNHRAMGMKGTLIVTE